MFFGLKILNIFTGYYVLRYDGTKLSKCKKNVCNNPPPGLDHMLLLAHGLGEQMVPLLCTPQLQQLIKHCSATAGVGQTLDRATQGKYQNADRPPAHLRLELGLETASWLQNSLHRY